MCLHFKIDQIVFVPIFLSTVFENLSSISIFLVAAFIFLTQTLSF